MHYRQNDSVVQQVLIIIQQIKSISKLLNSTAILYSYFHMSRSFTVQGNNGSPD